MEDISAIVPDENVDFEEIIANHSFDVKSHFPKVLPEEGRGSDEIIENRSSDIKSHFQKNLPNIMTNEDPNTTEISENCSKDIKYQSSMDLPAAMPREEPNTTEIIENCSKDIKYQSSMDLPAAMPREEPNTTEVIGNQLPDQEAENTFDEDVELPSNVTDRDKIFMPLDLKTDDPRIYGKWMWFSNGDLYLQDQMWIKLAVLILNRLVILQESSTAKKCHDRGRCQGVIKCYTGGDIANIKKAGVAIQNIIKDDVILHYKTNKASKDSRKRCYGDRFITQYMLTACGGLYEKDQLDRWTKVKDDVGTRTSSMSSVEAGIDGKTSPKRCSEDGPDVKASPPRYVDRSYLAPHRRRLDSSMLPSQENIKRRYFYPIHGNTEEFDGLWSLFCDIADFDYNGMCELDRMWVESKKLCDEGVFSFTSCETVAFRANAGDNPLKRCLSCVVKNYDDVSRVIQSGDRLREKTGYNIPMYFKVCFLNIKGKKEYAVRYLYTDDGELYEYVKEQWQLLTRRDSILF